MNVDEMLARHRPGARLTAEQRVTTLASLDAPDGNVTVVREGAGRVPSRRRVWLPAAAAAVAVLAGAGGLAAWRANDNGGGHEQAGGLAAQSTCTGTLPSSWAAARSTAPLTADGYDAVPHATAPDGSLLVSWYPTKSAVDFGLRANDGTVTPITSFVQTGTRGLGVGGTDGKYAVFTSSPNASANPNDIILVDIATKARTHLLPAAPAPASWVERSDVALQDGYVYWGMTPPNNDSHGIVIRYSIATHAYRVLDRPNQFPQVVSDVRGVAWPDGAVYRKNLPAALNPILDQAGNPVDRLVTDGHSYAWQLIKGDQSVFEWVDSAGTTRTFRLSLGAGHDGAALTAVSGPFLFFHVNQGSHTESVLDTRTGALAPSPLDETAWSYPGRHLVDQTSGFEYHAVNTSALPGFNCN